MCWRLFPQQQTLPSNGSDVPRVEAIPALRLQLDGAWECWAAGLLSGSYTYYKYIYIHNYNNRNIYMCVCVFQFHSEQTKRSRDGPFKDTQRLEACSHFKPLVCRSMFMVTARVQVEPSLQERCRDSLKVCYMLFLPRVNTHEHLPTLFSGFIWVGLPCWKAILQVWNYRNCILEEKRISSKKPRKYSHATHVHAKLLSLLAHFWLQSHRTKHLRMLTSARMMSPTFNTLHDLAWIWRFFMIMASWPLKNCNPMCIYR